MELSKELEFYKKKLVRLKNLKSLEPDNIYHDWDKEIDQCIRNIAAINLEMGEF